MNQKATESAVDAHASRLLRDNSSPETCVDPSLGPFVTSILRGRTPGDADSSLVELLESQCGMSSSSARRILCQISEVVKTGVVPSLRFHPATNCLQTSSPMTRGFRSKSVGAENDYDVRVLGEMLREAASSTASTCGRENSSPPTSFSYNSHVRACVTEGQGESENIEDDDEGCPAKEVCLFLLDEEEEEMERDQSQFSVPSLVMKERRVSFDETRSKPFNDYSSSAVLSPASVRWTNANTAHMATVTKGESNSSSFLVSSGHGDFDGECLALDASDSLSQTNSDEDIERVTKISTAHGHTTSNNGIKISSKKLRKQQSRDEANDLAAALFRPSRSRSNSLMEHPKSPALRPMSAPNTRGNGIGSQISNIPLDAPSATNSARHDVISNRDYQPAHAGINSTGNVPMDKRVEFSRTAQLLLTMNSHLSNEAATHASLISNSDLNLAQYIVEAARSAPPICRHLLKGACYRSDCTFSHEIEGHTCLFWLRGRCSRGGSSGVGDRNKGDVKTCRFLHGFSKRLLDEINNDYLKEQPKSQVGNKDDGTGTLVPGASTIRTANLLHYNSSMLTRQHQLLHKQEQQRLSSSLPKNNGSSRINSAATALSLFCKGSGVANESGFSRLSTADDNCKGGSNESEFTGRFVGNVGGGADIWSA